MEPEAPRRGAVRSTVGAALSLLLIVLGAPWWEEPRRTFDRLDIASADRSLFAVQPRFVHLAAVDCSTP